ncbi:MAG: tetratricopeptide repeat protein, partial [Candidatus Thermoplasmatota archaeon]|nr:tetratricopeptide repeat protein [Candidatus Thermoplasmatota archaeon]
MTGSIAEDVANILEAEVGELSRYILKKQCAQMNISVDSIEENDLTQLALKLSESVMVFGRDKAARVQSRVKALEKQDRKAEMGSENAFARHLELAEGARTLGNTIEERKHLERAAKCGMPSAPVFLARYHLLMGDLMLREGEKKRAMEEFQEALDASQKSGYEKGAEEAEYGIGNVYWRLGEYQKGMEVMRKCIDRCSRSRDERMAGKIYMALANIHDEWGKFEEALEYASVGKKKLTAVNDQYGLCTLHNNLGVLYARRGLYEESIEEYKQCIDAASKIGYTMMEGWAMFNAAEDHARMGNFSEA